MMQSWMSYHYFASLNSSRYVRVPIHSQHANQRGGGQKNEEVVEDTEKKNDDNEGQKDMYKWLRSF